MLTFFQIFFAAALLIGGLSQMYAGGLWLGFYRRLSERGAPAVRLYGAGVLAIGLLIVIVHNVWSGPVLVLTLLGWIMVAEGATCLAAPKVGLAGFHGLDVLAQARAVFMVGVFAVVMAGVLAAGILWK